MGYRVTIFFLSSHHVHRRVGGRRALRKKRAPLTRVYVSKRFQIWRKARRHPVPSVALPPLPTLLSGLRIQTYGIKDL